VKKFLLTAGIIFILIAVFSVQLKIDNDAGWGTGRIMLAASGVLFITMGWISSRFSSNIKSLIRSFLSLNSNIKGRVYLTAAFFISVTVYFFYALPQFQNEDSYFDYYGRLATAFRHGQVSLLEEPPQSLLSLSNPYDYQLRYETGVVNEIPIDVSLYNGKYYFYWGPAPSLFLVMFSDQQIAQIKDKHISFIFACGLFFYMLLTINKLWERYNTNLPSWFLGVFALVTGLSMPSLWMIRAANIYDAAVFGAQFFLIGGLYWTYCGLFKSKAASLNLFIGGIHLALAMGTRATVWFAIFLSSAVTLLYLLNDFRLKRDRQAIIKLIAFALPPFLALVLLGWYNYERFDSVTEFGFRYQLALADYSNFTPFSALYFWSNIHNYFTYPVHLINKFPYLMPTENIASNERLSGLLLTSPILITTVLPLLRQILIYVKSPNKKTRLDEVWVLLSFGGGFVLMLLTILFYYYPAVRFIEDFAPLSWLFIFILIAKVFNKNQKSQAWKAYLNLCIVLGIWSIMASIFLSMPLEYVVKINRTMLQLRNWLLGFGIG